MSNENNLNIGLTFGDKMLLTAYAELISADLDKLTRQAKQCRALIDVGGVYYINVTKFLQKREEIQQKRDEAKDKRKSDTTTKETIETTDKVGILRGQRTRLTSLIANEEKELEDLPRKLAAETDPDKKKKLKVRQDNLPVMIESNRETLEKVAKRMNELGLETETEDANPEVSSED